MPRSVLSRPKVSHSQGRNAFDRSFVSNFHQSAGMIIPVMMEPCVAGTKGVINRRVFTRGVPVVAPAFQDVQQHFDFFKIPLRLLLTAWNDWKLNINDINSSTVGADWTSATLNLSLPTSVPRFNFGSNLNTRIMTLSGFQAQAGARFLNNANRLLEGLGYGRMQSYSQVSESPNVQSLFALAAYQKVYFDHYRNSTYESNNPFAYNLDYLYSTAIGTAGDLGSVPSGTEWIRLRDMLTLRYVNYRNDYFHNIYPALTFSVSSPDGTSWQIPTGVQQINWSSISSNQYPTINNGSVAAKVTIASNQFGTITPQNIRAAFALDKLLRASAYTPKHVRDQFKARFGVDVGVKNSFESERIGSFYHTINFGEVTNQAASQDYSLGEIAGKAIGADNFGKDLHFYCEEDSIILGVSYILPRGMYDSMQDEWNSKLVREDFFQPEFQNLGLRPIYGKYFFQSDQGTISPNAIIGYTVPNQRYKIGRDLNFGQFRSDTYVYGVASGSVVHSYVPGVFSPFTVHTTFAGYFQSQSAVSSDFFKVRPSDLDDIFVSAYDSSNGDPRTDHFFSNVQFKLAVTSPMDVHGQPYL